MILNDNHKSLYKLFTSLPTIDIEIIYQLQSPHSRSHWPL